MDGGTQAWNLHVPRKHEVSEIKSLQIGTGQSVKFINQQ